MRRSENTLLLQAGGFAFFFGVAIFFVSSALADGPDVVRVEEDWELVIGTPDSKNAAPQVTCVMAPVDNLNGVYTTFLVNHRNTPKFMAGGMELQAWNATQALVSSQSSSSAVLETAQETIRWTMVMRLQDDHLIWELVNGQSTTWGEFGGEGAIRITLNSDLSNLNGYSPTISAKHSGVSYAANRVQSLTLRSVRTYSASGLIAEDNQAKVIHGLNE